MLTLVKLRPSSIDYMMVLDLSNETSEEDDLIEEDLNLLSI